jgi:DNA polymerase III epsilon subunit family exonuclease
MSEGGSTVVSVISPSVTAQVRGGFDGAPAARAERRGPRLELVRSALAETGARETGQRETGQRETGQRETGQRESRLGDTRLGDAELSEVELSEVEFAVVDLETTGWSPLEAAITEIGAVRVRGGQRRGEFASLVNPGTPVPPKIEDLTGISDWMLAVAPRLGTVLPGLLEFSRDCVLVAHNAPFDLGFLTAACGTCGVAWPGFTVLDTVMLARQVMNPDEIPDCKLGTLAGFFRARTTPSHRALADARATAHVLGWLIRRLTHQGVRTLGQLQALGQLRAWPDVVA